MSFFRKIADTYRAVNEGRATAQAHQMAEQFLAARLPQDVAVDGYKQAASVADLSSVEEMALIYVTTYAKRMIRYLDAVNATSEFRMQVARNVARACICLADLQRSGERFNGYQTRELIQAAQKLGVKTDSPEISFVV